MSQTINILIYQEVLNNSLVLNILLEQSSISNEDKDKIILDLPNCFDNFSDEIIRCTISILSTNGNIILVGSIQDYDSYIKLLEYLKYKYIDKFIDMVNQKILETFNTQQYDNNYLYDLCRSCMAGLIDTYDGKINIDLQHLLYSHKKNTIDYQIMNKLLSRACHDQNNQFILLNEYQFLQHDISFDTKVLNNFGMDHIETDCRIIHFDIDSVYQMFCIISYGILNREFIDAINDLGNVYLAGGSLLGCLTKDMASWSDIDIWFYCDNPTTLLTKLSKLLELIENEIRKINSPLPIWSINKNVITLCIGNYSRNIQIIINNKPPEQCVLLFDLDYVQCYCMNNKIYGNVKFLRSLINNTIYDVQNNSNDTRLMKAILKGYKIDKCINYKGAIDIYESFKKCNDDDEYINGLISNVVNKYYYPTIYEVIEYNEMVNGTSKYRTCRAVYMINTIIGHKQIFSNRSALLKFIEKYPITKFSSNYYTSKFQL